MRGWITALGFLALCSAPLPAAAVETSLPDAVAAKLRAVLPGYEITVIDSLTLKLGKHGAAPGKEMQVNLDRIADYCARVPDGCAAEMTDFINKTVKTVPVVLDQASPPATGMLRAVVRPQNYVTQMTSMLKGVALVSTPFAGDLVMVCYLDMPTAMRPATTKDVEQLGMAQDAMIEACRKNMRTALPKLLEKPPAEFANGRSIGYLQGDPYESSYLLLHDDWVPLVRALGGHLLVAAPGADLILYGQDSGPASVDAFAILAKGAYGQAQRPISAMVFRWTPRGWDVAWP